MMAHNSKGKQTDDPQCLAYCTEHGDGLERPSGQADETTYPLQSEANRKRLLAAIENINAGRSLVEIS
jgi:hypothetical protein